MAEQDLIRHRLSPADVASIIARLELARRLAGFDPHVVGSVPLDIHLASSDIDICCCAGPDLGRFKRALDGAYSHETGYGCVTNVHSGEPSVIARFEIVGVPVEIYGRSRPVAQHESFIHFDVERRLLALAGPALAAAVRGAKLAGLKTEPAFAHCLKLNAEGFRAMLELADETDAQLKTRLEAAGFACPAGTGG